MMDEYEWSIREVSENVYCIEKDAAGYKISWAENSPTGIAVNIVIAHVWDGRMVENGVDDLLVTLPQQDADELLTDVLGSDVLDDGDGWLDCRRLAFRTNLDDLVLVDNFDVNGALRMMLTNPDVVRDVLEGVAGWTASNWILDVTVDGINRRTLADPLLSEYFDAADAERVARLIDEVDLVDELINYDSRYKTLDTDGVALEICLREIDEDGDIINECPIVEQSWTWEEEHVYVKRVFDRLLRNAGLDIDADDARFADPADLPEWAQGINWDYMAIDRVDAMRDIDAEESFVRRGLDVDAADAERVKCALLFASRQLDRQDGRYQA